MGCWLDLRSTAIDSVQSEQGADQGMVLERTELTTRCRYFFFKLTISLSLVHWVALYEYCVPHQAP